MILTVPRNKGSYNTTILWLQDYNPTIFYLPQVKQYLISSIKIIAYELFYELQNRLQTIRY